MHIPIYIIGAFTERERILDWLLDNPLPVPYLPQASWLVDRKEDTDLTDTERFGICLRNEREIVHSFGCIYFPHTIPGLGREREIGMAMMLRRPVLMLREKSAHPLDHHPCIYPCSPADLVPTLRKVIPYAHAL